ncbi:protein BEAN1 isoform X3 [Passer domesticus]|uniref:protein BEAN1 isoform X3 n=1 Tax=Passer domesticus TaxID=48849 RepID=UPI0030FE6D90
METAGTAAGWVIFFHLPLISGRSISIGIGSNYSNLSIASNRSSAPSALPGRGEHGADSSLLVSPLLVAGLVIGLVLLLSCATIVVGSLRRDRRARPPRAGSAAADAPDGFSHGGSSAELRSTCSEELPPACDLDSYLDILSQVTIMYPDPPPRSARFSIFSVYYTQKNKTSPFCSAELLAGFSRR